MRSPGAPVDGSHGQNLVLTVLYGQNLCLSVLCGQNLAWAVLHDQNLTLHVLCSLDSGHLRHSLRLENNCFAVTRSSSKEGSYFRLVDFGITQLQAESNKEEKKVT